MPTQLGSAVLASALGPDEGLTVFADLRKARQCFVLENELHVIYLVIYIHHFLYKGEGKGVVHNLLSHMVYVSPAFTIYQRTL